MHTLDAFLDPLLGAAVVRVEELAQGAAMGVRQLLQSRPALEQIGDQGAVQVVEPVQNLREVQLQGSGETIAVAGFLVYQLAAFFYQEMQQAGLLGIRLQGVQRLTMAHQQIQQRSRVMGIALGARRGECLAVVRCGSGVYREQHQVRGIWSKYRPEVRETAPDRRQWGGRRSAVADSPPRLQWLREGCPTLPLHTAGSRPAGAARNASGWPSQWLQTRPILVLPACFSIIRTWGEPSFASEQGMVPTKFL